MATILVCLHLCYRVSSNVCFCLFVCLLACFFHDRCAGEIDSSELGKILEALGEDSSEERVTKAIAEVDLNANGKISFDEFMKFIQLVRSGDAQAVSKLAHRDFTQT